MSASEAAPTIPDHRLLRVVGHGSYGEVWLAQNVMGTGRAVKVVRRASFQSNRPYEREYSAIRRFEPLSRQADGLVHVLHAGRNDDEALFYYVMELADSAGPESSEEGSLEHYVPRTMAAEMERVGRLPLGDCLGIALSLTQALGALHLAGLAHRDVKPSNIIFVHGRAKLADIGLVQELGESRSFVGTEGYIPPEGPGTCGADLFSLGKVLYQACTGLEQSRYPELPQEWIAGDEAGAMEFFEVVLRACEADPARRYASAAEMQADLALLQSGRSVRRVRQLEHRVKALRRWGAVAGMAGALAAGGAWVAQNRAAGEAALRSTAEEALYLSELRHAAQAVRSQAREDALAAASTAARLKPGAVEPRDVAVSALALPGFRVWKRFPYAAGQPGDISGPPALDGRYEFWTEVDAARHVHIRRTTTGEQVAELPVRLPERWGSMSLSPDGKWLAAEAADFTFQLWPARQGAEPCLIDGPSHWVAAAFSPDSRQVAVAWRNGEVRLYRTGERGELGHFTLAQPDKPLQAMQISLAFSPDGGRLAAGLDLKGAIGAAGMVTVHDSTTRACLGRMETDSAVHGLAWHPGGAWLGLAMADSQITRWHPGDAAASPWVRHESAAVAVAFHPDGELAVTSSWDSTTSVWNVADGSLATRAQGWGLDPGFSTDGKFLALSDVNKRELIVYELTRPVVCCQLSLPRSPQTRPWLTGPNSLSIGNEGWIAAGEASGLWIAQSGQPGAVHFPWSNLQSAEMIGRRLFLSGTKGLALTDFPWAGKSGPAGFALQQIQAVSRSFNDSAFSSDGTDWAATTDQAIFFRKAGSPESTLPQSVGFYHVAVSGDGTWAAAASRGPGVVRAWPLQQPGAWKDIPAYGPWARPALSPDGKVLLIGDGNGLRAFHLPSFAPAWTQPGQEPGATATRCLYSPDSRWIAASLAPSMPWLLDGATGRPVVRLAHPFGQATGCLAFSADSRLLAVSGFRWTVFVWDLPVLRQELDRIGMNW